MSQPIKIAVIGMSGQGKSTFLNALADDGDDKEHFKEGASAGPTYCRNGVVQRSFQMEGADGHMLNIELVDTGMGFPDPDPNVAAFVYDEVAVACRQPLNAIVWVHQASREDYSTIEKLQSLMQEFNEASPPIYLVVNGFQNYGRRQGDATKEAKKKDLEYHEKIGNTLIEKSGIRVQYCLVGAERDDLYEDMKLKLACYLKGSVPQSSKLKTYAELKSQLDSCKSHDDQVALQLEKTQAAKNKEDSNLRGLQKKQSDLETAAAATTAGAYAVGFIPFAGPFVAAAALDTAAGLAAAASGMRGDIDKAVAQSRQALEVLVFESALLDKDAAAVAHKRALETFDKKVTTFAAMKRFKPS